MRLRLIMLVTVFVLAACGAAGDTAAEDTTTTGSPDTTAAPVDGIEVADTSLGEILVGPEGMTRTAENRATIGPRDGE